METEPKKKVTGLLLQGDEPLKMRRVGEGLYVAAENPYTERFGYFESTGLYDGSRARRRETAPPIGD